MSEKIIDLAKKVKALAEQGGTDGEKSAAEGRLKALMDKYGIKPEDIESEITHKVDISYPNRHKRLLNQVIKTVMGKDADIYYFKGSHKNLFRVYCTPVQEVEIRAMFDHYSRAYDKEAETFYRAFIQRNDLLPRDGGTLKMSELTEEEREEIMQILNMMEGMKKSVYHKQLEGQSHE